MAIGPCDGCGERPGVYRISDLTDGETVDVCPLCAPGWAVAVATAYQEATGDSGAPGGTEAPENGAEPGGWEDGYPQPEGRPGAGEAPAEGESTSEPAEETPAADVAQ